MDGHCTINAINCVVRGGLIYLLKYKIQYLFNKVYFVSFSLTTDKNYCSNELASAQTLISSFSFSSFLELCPVLRR